MKTIKTTVSIFIGALICLMCQSFKYELENRNSATTITNTVTVTNWVAGVRIVEHTNYWPKYDRGPYIVTNPPGPWTSEIIATNSITTNFLIQKHL